MKLRLSLASAVVLLAVAGLFFVNNSAGKTTLPVVQDKWQVASVADSEQFKNPAVPIVVVRVTSGLSEPDASAKKQFLVKEVIVENRSNKKVSSITLRWALSPLNNRLVVLSRGELAAHKLYELKKQLLAGQRQTLQLSHPKIGKLIEDIPNLEGMGTEFAFVIGVGEVVFEDGSTWKEVLTDVTKKSPSTN